MRSFGVRTIPLILMINPHTGKTIEVQHHVYNSAQLDANVQNALQAVADVPTAVASAEAAPSKPMDYHSTDTRIVKVNGHYTIVKTKG